MERQHIEIKNLLRITFSFLESVMLMTINSCRLLNHQRFLQSYNNDRPICPEWELSLASLNVLIFSVWLFDARRDSSVVHNWCSQSNSVVCSAFKDTASKLNCGPSFRQITFHSFKPKRLLQLLPREHWTAIVLSFSVRNIAPLSCVCRFAFIFFFVVSRQTPGFKSEYYCSIVTRISTVNWIP